MHGLPKDLIVTLIVEDPERIELIRILNLLDVTRVGDEVPGRDRMLVQLECHRCNPSKNMP